MSDEPKGGNEKSFVKQIEAVNVSPNEAFEQSEVVEIRSKAEDRRSMSEENASRNQEEVQRLSEQVQSGQPFQVVDPSGNPLINPTTQKPFESKAEFDTYVANRNARLQSALQELAELIPNHLIVLHPGGVLHASPSPTSELAVLCEMAQDQFKKAAFDTFGAMGFNSNPIESKMVLEQRKRAMQQQGAQSVGQPPQAVPTGRPPQKN